MGSEYAVFSRIMWEDYIIWVQGCRERVLRVLAEEMGKVVLEDGEIGFDLTFDTAS